MSLSPKAGESKTGETKNSMYADDKKSKGFGAEGMKGSDPFNAESIKPGAVDTPVEKERNEQREDKN